MGVRPALVLVLLLLISPPASADGPPAPDAPGAFGVGHTELTVVSELAIDDRPVAAARHPLIVFSHGSGGVNTQSTTLCEGLASHGFIVASPNHTGNTTDDFQNGTAVAFLQSAVDRPQDVSFVIDELLVRSAAPGDAFENRVRREGFGVAGHSFGGYTALAMRTGFQTAPADDRIIGVMAVAPASGLISDAALSAFDRPLMLLSGTLDTTTPIDDNTTRPFGLVPADVYRADIVGATHSTSRTSSATSGTH